jgi:hypothetical protein
MYAVLEDNKFIGFSLKEEQGYTNILISNEKHSELLECSGRSGVVALKNGELICTIRPSEYHEYNTETNEWIHDKSKEIEDLKSYLKALDKVLFEKEDLRDRATNQKRIGAAESFQDEIDELSAEQVGKQARLEELEV